jgi:hypothetical protein
MSSIKKGGLARRIHKALGLNTRFVEADPTQVIDTLTTVNDWMMSENGIGRRLGWNADSPNVDPDPEDETGLPDWAVLGVTYNCALVVAPYFDKEPSQLIVSTAMRGMQTIVQRTIELQTVQYPCGMPRGQGNRTTYGNRYFTKQDRIETFNDFLKDEGGEVITS